MCTFKATNKILADNIISTLSVILIRLTIELTKKPV